MREKLLVALVLFSASSVFAIDCSVTPSYEVRSGCPAPAAAGDGTTDDRAAIQQCLLAAGDFYEACRAGDPVLREQPVEVHLGAGTYFVGVSGAIHTNVMDERYQPQWVPLVMPRGTALRGNGVPYYAGANATVLTIKKTNDTRATGRTGERSGTYLLVAGLEKAYKPSTQQHYCDEDSSRPLCRHADGSLKTQQELELGGGFNALYDLELRGDTEAIIRDQQPAGNVTGLSCAILVVDGFKFRMNNVWIDQWYRGAHIYANGVDVRNSFFVNNIKAGLYINGSWDAPYEGRVPAYTAAAYGSQPIDVYANWLGNEETWIASTKNLITTNSAVINLFQDLHGFFFGGNIRPSCGNLTFNSNRLYRGRAQIETPCGSNLTVQNNWFSYQPYALSVGGSLGGPPDSDWAGVAVNQGLFFAHADIRGNTIDHSIAGIMVQGCNFYGYSLSDRCAYRRWDQATIEDNTLDTFLPFGGPGSDAFLNEAATTYFGSGTNVAGIVLSDISGITMNRNHVRDLKRGSQIAGVMVQTSFRNTRLASQGWSSLDCYAPYFYNENIALTSNEFQYSPDAKANGTLGFPSHAIGLYAENTLNFTADIGTATSNAEESRSINTQLTGATSGFTGVRCNRDTDPYCKRAMINGDHSMSTLEQQRLSLLTNDKRYYCSQQAKQNDEEYNLH